MYHPWPSMEFAMTTYKLDPLVVWPGPSMAMDGMPWSLSTGCDVIAGVHILDDKFHLVPLEGVHSAGINELWHSLPHPEGRYFTCLVYIVHTYIQSWNRAGLEKGCVSIKLEHKGSELIHFLSISRSFKSIDWIFRPVSNSAYIHYIYFF